ncbi:hypothetical protein BUALT_Bualt04G0171200 [Buddleja alternifolia]|uniref:Uncharacterized protein n=1 Tax=Buddleja alternifolia TaxID=168488 RepID=A0AAV6XR54_9LAMI|nr:hypothetical protein BUALT_Bualt04G0171200 [Buddleja alternifolia]
MSAGKACLNSISRRTRSGWDAFYRNRYDEIKKKPDQESDSNGNVECSIKDNHDSSSQDSESSSSVKKRVNRKNRTNTKSINIEDFDIQTVVLDSEGESDEDYKLKHVQKKATREGKRPTKKKAVRSGECDSITLLVDSIWKESGLLDKKPLVLEKNDMNQTTLPLKFRFEDDNELPDKTEWEKEIDSLFCELEMGLWESEIGCTNTSSTNECTIDRDIDENPAARCSRGQHDHVLDEQIGIKCVDCSAILLDIKYVLPPFSFYVSFLSLQYVEPPERRERKYWDQSEPSVNHNIHFESSTADNLESSVDSNGTVLDLIPNSEKEMYPHQLEGLKFLWRNIAGDIHIKKLEKLPANGGQGCIISHAPGTGKTRLTIVFLQTFMKLYPNCRPVIIAPRGMLLTWEQEFQKWKVDIKFHNLNETKLSRHETAIAAGFVGGHENNKDYIRFIKLYSWMKSGGILGISYRLFETLAGEHEKKGCEDKYKKILLELPGLLVMDEGHTPRNNQSLMWKALTNITTQRRVILSGTPFQNNFSELYNTLSLVNPRFSQQMTATSFDRKFSKKSGRKRKINEGRDEWVNLTSSINKNTSDDIGLKKLRLMIEPFVHVHKGSILQKTLPGIKDCLVLLKPTDLQKKLLENITRVDKFLEQVYLASLISVHPALVSDKPEFSDHKRKLKQIESDPNAGVKTRFLIELIKLSNRLNEKVLIFSQFIDPLLHIKQMLKSNFSWNEGREVIYMDGDISIKQRQSSINSFNDKNSEAKVLLASQRACSEGINLVGASRVVLLDVVWNPSVERQAISRAYRLGQEKVVYVYHLVTLMEVKKFARQAEKERIAEMVFCPEIDGGKTASDNVVDSEDKVLEAMVGHERVGCIFERIVNQPKEADLVNTFGFVDVK